MEVRQIIDSNLLNDIIPLPRTFQNKKVEVIVLLPEEKADLPSLTEDEINEMLKGSITETLIGAVPDSGKSLEDYRSERLKKYEHFD